jgi:hypothetical protein
MYQENLMTYLKDSPSVRSTPRQRPDYQPFGLKDRLRTGLNLLVGGAVTPPGKWETLDPFQPGRVTYRERLENRELAQRLRGRFDSIFFNAVLEHVNPLFYFACVENLHTMLKPDGLLLVELPWLWQYHPGDRRYSFGGDFARLTAEGLRRLFIEHPNCSWECLNSSYFIPPDCPEGVAVSGLFRKAAEADQST